jgi:hypothetical protein
MLTQRGHRIYYSSVGQTINLLPTDMHKASVYKCHNQYVLLSHRNFTTPIQKPAHSLRELLHKCSDEERPFLANIVFSDDASVIATALQTDSAIAVCYGSKKDGYGTAAWTIESSTAEGKIYGKVISPGTSTDHTSYRSELTGILSCVIFINKLCQFYTITQGSITLGCDGLSALDIVFKKKKIHPSIPSYDIVAAISKNIAMTPIRWSHVHVKGHQDQTPGSALDRWAKLNIAMDHLAKSHIPIAARTPTFQAIPSEPWSIYFQSSKITSKPVPTIYALVHSASAREYWENKSAKNSHLYNLTDLEALGKALSSIDLNRRIFILKHATGFCGVGKIMERNMQRETASCPRCGKLEDTHHVIQCSGSGAQEVWEQSLLQLEKWMSDRGTDPALASQLLAFLNSWHSQDISPRLSNYTIAQSLIGWHNAFEGWLAADISNAQQYFYSASRSLRTGRRWLIELIKKLWGIAWDMWEHRNGILHQQDNEVTRISTHRLHVRVSDAYQLLRTMALPAADYHLIQTPLRTLKKKHTDYIKAWLVQAKAILHCRLRAEWERRSNIRQRLASNSTLIRQLRSSMRTWLLPCRR